MDIQFTKMHGLGNDFVVIDAINQSVALDSATIRHIADRHFGVGCDQLLLVEQSQTAGVDFLYRIFNADGGEVEQCGNGARCFAVFVREKGLSDKDRIRVETASGIIELAIQADGQVTVNMGVPEFAPENIPFLAAEEQSEYTLEVAGQTLNAGVVSMGNPHAVLTVDDIDTAPLDTVGAAIEQLAVFPNRVNVGFMQILDRSHIRLRVYERGAGETLACGTGACAAMVVGQIQGKLDQQVGVQLPGGRLQITWQGAGSPVMMTGPATTVFEGRISL